jgi:hypothetical protein
LFFTTLYVLSKRMNQGSKIVPLFSVTDPDLRISVGDPDPQDPHVFRPPGSGSVIQRSGSFPFLIKVLSGLK